VDHWLAVTMGAQAKLVAGAYYKGINVLAFRLARGFHQNRELSVGRQHFGGAGGLCTAVSSRVFP
jgi:hypothetical protein